MNVTSRLLLCFGLAVSLTHAAESKSPPPAKVENAVKETDLATLKLTPQAEQRLGIVLAEAVRKKISVTRTFGGDVMVPLAPKGETPTGYFPLASATPDELLRLSDQQAIADGEIEKAKVQLEAAQRTLKRARSWSRERPAASERWTMPPRKSSLAEKALEVARTRRALLGAPVAERAPRPAPLGARAGLCGRT